jgi:predicted transcriptional regulator
VFYFVHHFENYEALTGTEELLTMFIMKLLKLSSEGETQKAKRRNNRRNAKDVSCAEHFSAVIAKLSEVPVYSSGLNYN